MIFFSGRGAIRLWVAAAEHSVHFHYACTIFSIKYSHIIKEMDDEYDLELPGIPQKAVSKKFKSKTKREDPLQYHAKPRDLDAALNAQEMPKEAEASMSTNIFSSASFSSFNLDKKLIATIERPEGEGGMGMSNCTKVQSVVYPTLLEKRQNMLIKSQTGSGKTMSIRQLINHAFNYRKLNYKNYENRKTFFKLIV